MSLRSRLVAFGLTGALILTACSGGSSGSKVAEPATAPPEALPLGSEPLLVGVIVPDYTALIATGEVPRMTPDFYADRWRAEAAEADAVQAMGVWSARFQVITWDPVGGAAPVCQAIDASRASLFVSAVRLPPAIHECLEADDRLAITLTHGAEASLSVQPRTSELTRAAVAHLNFAQLLAGPVAIVAGDDMVGQRAARGLARALDAVGIRSSTVTVPTSQGVRAVRRAAVATLDTLRSSRPATVLFASNTTVAVELGPDLVTGPWQLVGVDVDGLTEQWAARRLPAAWQQVPVVSALVPTTLPDSEFEASCRRAFESFAAGEALRAPRAGWPFSVGRGVHSTRGAVDGSQSPPPDIGYHECTITRALSTALATVDPPYDTQTVDAALWAGTHDVALGRRGTLADKGALAHHTLLVRLRPPDDLSCAAAGQQCWVTASGDRSGMVPFE